MPQYPIEKVSSNTGGLSQWPMASNQFATFFFTKVKLNSEACDNF